MLCFVHVLDDSTVADTRPVRIPPFDARSGKDPVAVRAGIQWWVASHREPVVISNDKESDPRSCLRVARGKDLQFVVGVPMETIPGRHGRRLNAHRRIAVQFTEARRGNAAW